MTSVGDDNRDKREKALNESLSGAMDALKRNDQELFRRSRERFSALCGLLLERGENLDPGGWRALYTLGCHDQILNGFGLLKGKGGDLLARMASSVFFARGEPQMAVAACKYISNEEERRLRLKTAELWSRINAPLQSEPRVHLLVLTHNRVDYVAQALRELANTDYKNYAVYIADNGSHDGTLEAAREALSFFPKEVPVHLESLPTNLGRPAGHNWLLSAHDHGPADYIAIGDDDLLRVPPDWLRKMVQTAGCVPRCACVGLKALSPGRPAGVHGAVFNILEFGEDRIVISNSGTDDLPDLGQFDFLDIVDHVNGCLHIYDRRVLDEAGHFDIRFSPAQFVDVEHHLRLRLVGHNIVFNGLIEVEHYRAMGVTASKSRAWSGNALGNLVKLLYKYDKETVDRELAARREERREWLFGTEKS